jgi:hypothetical protein
VRQRIWPSSVRFRYAFGTATNRPGRPGGIDCATGDNPVLNGAAIVMKFTYVESLEALPDFQMSGGKIHGL